jgi:hypothetical protein
MSSTESHFFAMIFLGLTGKPVGPSVFLSLRLSGSGFVRGPF